MAKSLRSKWKRKMRAAKRERYGKKELEKLKMVLGLNTTDVEMKEEKLDDDVVIVTNAEEIKKKMVAEAEKEVEEVEVRDEAVEVRDEEVEVRDEEVEVMDDGRRVYNKKTMKDQHGNYPVWLSSRKLKKAVKRNHANKRSQKKKGKKS